MTTGADSWQVAGLWGDAAQCENAASGLTKKKDKEKKLNLKKRCTFRGILSHVDSSLSVRQKVLEVLEAC